ncbi:Cilia- and flagella-associated protein 91 [Gonapodya sp. JEL0774]|nr:Cilia- and flagella-associated protein 91 [Gonapodya sp. JEL0774]
MNEDGVREEVSVSRGDAAAGGGDSATSPEFTFEYLAPKKKLRAMTKAAATSTTATATAPESLANPVTSHIANTHIATQIYYLTTQIHRLRTHQKVLALAKLAERTRKLREAEEEARRDDELRRQREEDEIMRQVLGVHHETVETWLEEVLCGAVQDVAANEARDEVRKNIEEINHAVLGLQGNNGEQVIQEDVVGDATNLAEKPVSIDPDLQTKNASQGDSDLESYVAGLVQSFLLPQVEKDDLKQRVQQEQHKYLLAAHRAIHSVIPAVENESRLDGMNHHAQPLPLEDNVLPIGNLQTVNQGLVEEQGGSEQSNE